MTRAGQHQREPEPLSPFITRCCRSASISSSNRNSASMVSTSVVVSPIFFALWMQKHRRTTAPFGVPSILRASSSGSCDSKSRLQRASLVALVRWGVAADDLPYDALENLFNLEDASASPLSKILLKWLSCAPL